MHHDCVLGSGAVVLCWLVRFSDSFRSRLRFPTYFVWMTSLVQVSLPAYNEVPTTHFQFDFDFERKLLGLQTEEAGGPLHLGEDGAEPSNEEEAKVSEQKHCCCYFGPISAVSNNN